jgi:hypothetical protein
MVWGGFVRFQTSQACRGPDCVNRRASPHRLDGLSRRIEDAAIWMGIAQQPAGALMCFAGERVPAMSVQEIPISLRLSWHPEIALMLGERAQEGWQRALP